MQKEMSKTEMRDLFFVVRQLADAHLAALAAWRDVLEAGERADMSIVPNEYLEQFLDVATRDIQSLKWLTSLSPDPLTDGPRYWVEWKLDVLAALREHLDRTAAIMLGLHTL